MRSILPSKKTIDLFGEGRLVKKLSYFRPIEGFLRAHSHSYTTKKRHKVGRKESILARCETRQTSLILSFIKWSIFLLFILGNIISYNHAYQFTHFTEMEGKRKKPEELSISEKMSILFWGINNPRPKNDQKPQKAYQIITIDSHEQLEAWLIEQPNHKGAVLLCHGYSSNKSSLLKYSDAFHKMGYSTLLLDFMGSGGSTGNQTTIGVKEGRDVQAAYAFLQKKYPDTSLLLFGSSMGAAAIMRSLTDYNIQPAQLILECPFGTMLQTTRKRFSAMGLPSSPFSEILLFYGSLQNGFNAFAHNPITYAKNIQTPILLLHGLKDKRVTSQEITQIYNNLQGPKVFMQFPQSGHENYLVNSRTEWEKVVQQFLEKDYLKQ